MGQLLGDNTSQFFGVAFGVAGILATVVVGVVFYRLGRPRKELGYRVLSNTRVVSVQGEMDQLVQILYLGQPVRDVHLLVLQVVNSGNEPIVADDYQCNLNIGLGDGARVLTAELVESDPEGLTAWPVLAEACDTVHVHPLLLNAGDWFKLKILVTGFSGLVRVNGRIVGVKEIKALGERASSGRQFVGALIGVLLVLLAGMATLVGAQKLLGNWLLSWSAVLVIVAVGVWILSKLFDD